jgi:hypothetical protein
MAIRLEEAPALIASGKKDLVDETWEAYISESLLTYGVLLQLHCLICKMTETLTQNPQSRENPKSSLLVFDDPVNSPLVE